MDERRFTPSDAARFVKAHATQHAWIPGPVKLATPLRARAQPSSRGCMRWAPRSRRVKKQDARRPLPNLADLPSARQFESLSADHRRLVSIGSVRGRESLGAGGTGSSEAIESIAATLEKEFSEHLRRQAWRPYAIVAGINGGTAREVWEQLIRGIEDAAEANAQCALARHHRPQLSKTLPAHKQKRIAQEIVQHLEAGKGLSMLQMATHSEWRQFVKSSAVASGEPSRIEHFRVLAQLAELEVCRLEIEDAWNALVGSHINSLFRSMGPEPELACRALTDEISRCLDWHAKTWSALFAQLDVRRVEARRAGGADSARAEPARGVSRGRAAGLRSAARTARRRSRSPQSSRDRRLVQATDATSRPRSIRRRATKAASRGFSRPSSRMIRALIAKRSTTRNVCSP